MNASDQKTASAVPRARLTKLGDKHHQEPNGYKGGDPTNVEILAYLYRDAAHSRIKLRDACQKLETAVNKEAKMKTRQFARESRKTLKRGSIKQHLAELEHGCEVLGDVPLKAKLRGSARRPPCL